MMAHVVGPGGQRPLGGGGGGVACSMICPLSSQMAPSGGRAMMQPSRPSLLTWWGREGGGTPLPLAVRQGGGGGGAGGELAPPLQIVRQERAPDAPTAWCKAPGKTRVSRACACARARVLTSPQWPPKGSRLAQPASSTVESTWSRKGTLGSRRAPGVAGGSSHLNHRQQRGVGSRAGGEGAEREADKGGDGLELF